MPKNKRLQLRINDETYTKLNEFPNKSQIVRKAIKSYLSKDSGMPKIKTGDWQILKKELEGSPSLQVIGNVGMGKSFTINKLIKNDKKYTYIVFDAHNEYDLPKIDTISNKIQSSCKVELPPQVAGAKGLFPLYVNQILSKKWPENYIFVVEESARYKANVLQLLRESRKFAKIIAISQDKLCDFVPIVKIIG